MRSPTRRTRCRAPTARPLPETGRAARRSEGRASPRDLDPTLLMRAARHGVEDEHLVVPIREGRIAEARSAFRHRAIHRRVERLEGLAEALGVSARQPGGSTALFVHDRGVAKQDLAGPPAMAEPQLVR